MLNTVRADLRCSAAYVMAKMGAVATAATETPEHLVNTTELTSTYTADIPKLDKPAYAQSAMTSTPSYWCHLMDKSWPLPLESVF